MDLGTLTGTIDLDDQMSGALDAVQAKVSSFADAFLDELGPIGVAVGVVATALGALGAATVALAEKGSQVNDLTTSFDRLAGSTQNASDILSAMKDGTAGTIDNLQLMQMANKELATGAVTTAADFGTLSAASMALSKEGFGPIPDLMNSINRAMETGRATRLSLMGVSVDAKGAEKDYAASLGETTTQLTQAQKLFADRQAIMVALNKTVADAGTQQLTFANTLQQAEAAIGNWLDELSSAVEKSPEIQAAVQAVKDVISQTFGTDSQSLMDQTIALINEFARTVKEEAPLIQSSLNLVLGTVHALETSMQILVDLAGQLTPHLPQGPSAANMGNGQTPLSAADTETQIKFAAALDATNKGLTNLTTILTGAKAPMTDLSISINSAKDGFDGLTKSSAGVTPAVQAIISSLTDATQKQRDEKTAIDDVIASNSNDISTKIAVVAAIEKLVTAHEALTPQMQRYLDLNTDLTPKSLALKQSLSDLSTTVMNLSMQGEPWEQIMMEMGPAAAALAEKAKDAGVSIDGLDQMVGRLAAGYTDLKRKQDQASDFAEFIANIQAINDAQVALQASIVAADKAANDAIASQNEDAQTLRLRQINEQEKAQIDALTVEFSGHQDVINRLTAIWDAFYQHERDQTTGFYDYVDESRDASDALNLTNLDKAQNAAYSYYNYLLNVATDSTAQQIALAKKAWEATVNAEEDAQSQIRQDEATTGQDTGELGSAFDQLASKASGPLKTALSDVGTVLGQVSTVAKDLASGNVLGAVISAVTSIISDVASLFSSTPEWQKDMTDVGTNWGVTITDALAKTIAANIAAVQATVKTASTSQIGASQAYGATQQQQGEALSLDAIISGGGGLNSSNLDLYEGKAQALFSTIALGGATGQQAVQQLDKVLGDFSALAAPAGQLWSSSFSSLVDQSAKLGLNLASVTTLLNGQVQNATAGITTALGVTSAAYTALATDQTTLGTLQTDYAASTVDGQAAIQAKIDATNADMKTQQGIIAATTISSQGAATAVAASLEVGISNAVKNGSSLMDAIKAQGPAIQGLQQQLSATGFSGGAAFRLITQQLGIATGAISGPALTALEGYTQDVIGLANAGALTQDSFSGLESQIGSTYTALTSQGTDGNALLISMQDELQKAWEAEQKFGYKADDVTQGLINQALAAGEIGPSQESSSDQMITALDTMVKLLGQIADAFTGPGGMADAAATAATNTQKSLDGIKAPNLTVHVATVLDAPTGGSSSPTGPNDNITPGQLDANGLPIVPEASGGSGHVSGPTTFYSAGDEDFSFSGEGKSFGGQDASGGGTLIVPVQLPDGTVLTQLVVPNLMQELQRLGMVGRR